MVAEDIYKAILERCGDWLETTDTKEITNNREKYFLQYHDFHPFNSWDKNNLNGEKNTYNFKFTFLYNYTSTLNLPIVISWRKRPWNNSKDSTCLRFKLNYKNKIRKSMTIHNVGIFNFSDGSWKQLFKYLFEFKATIDTDLKSKIYEVIQSENKNNITQNEMLSLAETIKYIDKDLKINPRINKTSCNFVYLNLQEDPQLFRNIIKMYYNLSDEELDEFIRLTNIKKHL